MAQADYDRFFQSNMLREERDIERARTRDLIEAAVWLAEHDPTRRTEPQDRHR